MLLRRVLGGGAAGALGAPLGLGGCRSRAAGRVHGSRADGLDAGGLDAGGAAGARGGVALPSSSPSSNAAAAAASAASAVAAAELSESEWRRGSARGCASGRRGGRRRRRRRRSRTRPRSRRRRRPGGGEHGGVVGRVLDRERTGGAPGGSATSTASGGARPACLAVGRLGGRARRGGRALRGHGKWVGAWRIRVLRFERFVRFFPLDEIDFSPLSSLPPSLYHAARGDAVAALREQPRRRHRERERPNPNPVTRATRSARHRNATQRRVCSVRSLNNLISRAAE